MPTLNLYTNVPVDGVVASDILKDATKAVAKIIGKPESYVMILVNGGVPISFGGTEEPAAYGELVSIGGLGPTVNGKLSATIAEILQTKLSIDSARFYIKFYDVQTRTNPQKGAKNSWSVAEDLALMSAWCFVSEDKRCGKNQKGSSLWTCIAGTFEQSRLENPEGICERNLDSMKGRYKRLNENVNKWRGAYMEAYRNKRSGMSMKDVEKEAHIIYEAGGSTKFTDLHVFEEVMRKHPKWELNLDRDSTRSRPEDDVSNEESRGSSKRSKTNEDGDYSIPLNLESPISDGSAIPLSEGRDMAKKEGKNVASQSSSIPDEFTPAIRALRITRNNEYDLMTKIANDMMELERKKEERKIKKMNMMMLNTLLAKDHLSPEDEEMKRHLTTIVFGKSL